MYKRQTLSKPTGTGLTVTANATIGGTLDVSGVTTLTGALDANSTADIADTLTLSKPTGTGLTVTSNATIGGTLGVTGVTTLSSLEVTGNLTVSGTTTTVNSTEVEIGDNVIILNTAVDSSNANSNLAGLEINRGSEPSVRIIWDETNDYWAVGTPTANAADSGTTNNLGTIVADTFKGDFNFNTLIDRDSTTQLTTATADTKLSEYLNDIYYKLYWLDQNIVNNITINPTPQVLTFG